VNKVLSEALQRRITPLGKNFSKKEQLLPGSCSFLLAVSVIGVRDWNHKYHLICTFYNPLGNAAHK